ncbi:hypothetical protein [Paenibacillus wenxiniae]|uniref:Anti-sigma factor n=1 Tax=Paenibacillus wenxiniae TaxID=1636843 RepID=A0ABW4RM26_9BACL
MTTSPTREERLFQAIGQVDDVLLERLEQQLQLMEPVPSTLASDERERAMSSPRRRRSLRIGIASALAVVAVAACLFMFSSSWPSQPAMYTASEPVVNSYISNQKQPADVSPAMQMPANGTVLYSPDVKQALQANQGKQVVFLVAIDLFHNRTPMAQDSEQTRAELKRLQQLDYTIGYSRYWTYAGENQQVNGILVAGYLTAAQLEQFATSPNYGYSIHFAVNGDGSPIPAEQGIFTDPHNPALK